MAGLDFLVEKEAMQCKSPGSNEHGFSKTTRNCNAREGFDSECVATGAHKAQRNMPVIYSGGGAYECHLLGGDSTILVGEIHSGATYTAYVSIGIMYAVHPTFDMDCALLLWG